MPRCENSQGFPTKTIGCLRKGLAGRGRNRLSAWILGTVTAQLFKSLKLVKGEIHNFS